MLSRETLTQPFKLNSTGMVCELNDSPSKQLLTREVVEKLQGSPTKPLHVMPDKCWYALWTSYYNSLDVYSF